MGKQWVKQVVYSPNVTINNELDGGSKFAPFFPRKYIRWKSDPRRCMAQWEEASLSSWCVHGHCSCPAAAPFSGTPGPSGKDCCHGAFRPQLEGACPMHWSLLMDLGGLRAHVTNRCLQGRQATAPVMMSRYQAPKLPSCKQPSFFFF